MDTNRVARATAEHLFRLYLMNFTDAESQEEAMKLAGMAVERYLRDCGMSEQDAIKLRDEIMISYP